MTISIEIPRPRWANRSQNSIEPGFKFEFELKFSRKHENENRTKNRIMSEQSTVWNRQTAQHSAHPGWETFFEISIFKKERMSVLRGWKVTFAANALHYIHNSFDIRDEDVVNLI
jgi:hypothetical protein